MKKEVELLRPLKADLFIEEYNLIVEVNGYTHYN
jgi:hypothetical protein